MKRWIILCLAFSSGLLSANAGSTVVKDSLLRIYVSAPHDSTRLDVLHDIAGWTSRHRYSFIMKTNCCKKLPRRTICDIRVLPPTNISSTSSTNWTWCASRNGWAKWKIWQRSITITMTTSKPRSCRQKCTRSISRQNLQSMKQRSCTRKLRS